MAETFHKIPFDAVLDIGGLVSDASGAAKVLQIIAEQAYDSGKDEVVKHFVSQAPGLASYNLMLLTDDQLEALQYSIRCVVRLTSEAWESWAQSGVDVPRRSAESCETPPEEAS